jgi:hypothetical protein
MLVAKYLAEGELQLFGRVSTQGFDFDQQYARVTDHQQVDTTFVLAIAREELRKPFEARFAVRFSFANLVRVKCRAWLAAKPNTGIAILTG